MKKNILLAILALTSVNVFSQLGSYNFTTTNTPYQPTIITDTCNDERIIEGSRCSDAWSSSGYFRTTLPFKFKVLNYMNDSIGITKLNIGSLSGDNDTFYFNLYFGFNHYFRPSDRNYDENAQNQKLSISRVLSYVDGVAPNRVYKFELQNCKVTRSTSALDSFNCMLRLYEGTNVFEMHYGPSNFSTPSSTLFKPNEPQGLLYGWTLDKDNFDGGAFSCIESNLLKGSYANPMVVVKKNDCAIDASMPLLPPNGTLYRFTPKTSTMGKNVSANGLFEVYPTLTSDYINLKKKGNAAIEKIEILSINGQILKTYNSFESKLSVEDLENGLYLITIYSNVGISTMKFIKN